MMRSNQFFKMKLKKPKFWDYKKQSLLSYLLYPLTFFISINNLLLNLKTKKKYEKIITICIGNIYLGGTGKTPTTIKIYQILKKLNLNVSTAKKLYDSQIDEKIILEEKTHLITGNSRKEILIKKLENKKKIIIFDDGLQDKKIRYDLEFVCFDSVKWIGNGSLIPSGPLREKLNSLKKYDGVFLKGEDGNISEIISQIKKQNKEILIFRTYYYPTNLKKFDISEKYLMFCGIGNPNDFRTILSKNNFNIIGEIIYPDHHNYNKKDFYKIKKKASLLNAKIITTEKDFVKIPENHRENINFLEINLKVEDEDKLINYLKSKIYE